MKQKLFVAFLLLSTSLCVVAETVTLDLPTALERAQAHDPRISELEAMVRAAQATVKEAEGYGDIQANLTTFVGFPQPLTEGCSLRITVETTRFVPIDVTDTIFLIAVFRSGTISILWLSNLYIPLGNLILI